jgi:hypothetical protein
MSVLGGLARFFAPSVSAVNGSSINYGADVHRRTRARELSHRDLCQVLTAYAQVNGCYETLRALRFYVDADTANLKPVRNPCPAILGFFSSKAWPEPLELKTEVANPDALTAAIEQVWQWSNWGQRRRAAAYTLAMLGECFIKIVASREKQRVWFELIDATYVCDFEVDERDYLTWLRLDVPKCEINHNTGERRYYTRTEVWSVEDGTYRVWDTDGDAYAKALDDLGAEIPEESGTLAELGITFLPFVRIPFSDTGEKRAIGAIQPAIEAITESDLMATNHHQVLFQDLEGATVIERDGTDANNRPLPPVQVAAAQPTFDALGREINGTGRHADGSVQVGKRSFWSLPAGSRLTFPVPPIDFAASLATLKDHDEYLERIAPSLTYARVAMMSGPDLSGRALRYKLSASIDQALEVRSNLLTGLKQADEIALTLGQMIGLPDFRNLGQFDAGDFEHTFVERDVIDEGDLEEAQASLARGQAAQAYAQAGVPLALIATDVLDMTEKEATDMLGLAAQEAEASMQRAQDAFGTTSDQQQTQDQQNGAGATNA